MTAKVVLTGQAREELQALPLTVKARIDELLGRLEEWPDVSGVKHLKGDLKGKCRLRTGDYRLQFRVETVRVEVKKQQTVKGKVRVVVREEQQHTIIVEKAAHRDGFYD